MFQSIEKYCKTRYGYGSLRNVDDSNSVEDRMESFFLAETLKYLHLLFDPDSEIDVLNKVREVSFVFNLLVDVFETNTSLIPHSLISPNCSMYSIRRLTHSRYLKLTSSKHIHLLSLIFVYLIIDCLVGEY